MTASVVVWYFLAEEAGRQVPCTQIRGKRSNDHERRGSITAPSLIHDSNQPAKTSLAPNSCARDTAMTPDGTSMTPGMSAAIHSFFTTAGSIFIFCAAALL